MLKILAEYEKVLGQKINLKKKSLFFSKSTKEDVKEEIKNVLGVNEIRYYERYLGCPHWWDGVKKQASITLRR